MRELSVISDGALLIRDGVLIEVGPSRRVENLAKSRDAIEINAAGRVVMPGFVDAHTHLAYPLAGVSAADPTAAARAVHAATGQRLEQRARTYVEAMARHGSTTVEVKTGGGLDEFAETKLLRVVAALSREPLDLIPSFLFHISAEMDQGALQASTDWMVENFLPKIRRRGIQFADLVWNPAPELLPSFDRYLGAAHALGFACKIHADRLEPGAAIGLGVQHNVVSIDHLEHATEAEAQRLAGAGIMATLLPYAEGFLGRRQAPARAMLDAGAPIALGSNFNPQNNPPLSMQTALALACLRFKMTVEEAITAATINGAHALCRAEHVGTLEPGKQADVLILNAGHYQDLEHSIGTNLVHSTIKRGKMIYKEGEVAFNQADVSVGHS
jgi:imidazolonepropionase